MPYQITSTITKTDPDTPDFDVWVDRQTADLLVDYPEVAGKTPAQVIMDANRDIEEPAKGFVGAEASVSEDGLTWTLVQVWESQAAYQAATELFEVVDEDPETGDQEKKLKPDAYIKKVYNDTYTFENTQTVANI